MLRKGFIVLLQTRNFETVQVLLEVRFFGFNVQKLSSTDVDVPTPQSRVGLRFLHSFVILSDTVSVDLMSTFSVTSIMTHF